MKKIAVFTNAWNGEFLVNMLDGMKKRISDDTVAICVFNSYGYNPSDPNFISENNIYNLPDLSQFDGLIIHSINAGFEGTAAQLAERFRQSGKPAISIENKLEGLTFVGTDNYRSMYDLVEHMITVHHCKTLNYMGGPDNHPDNILRRKAYMDALTAHGIPIEERRIKNYHFVTDDGVLAYEDFKREGIEAPDVIIAANDDMAVGYCLAAREDGLDSPKDFLITGYDHSINARLFSPQLTTIDSSPYELGYTACDTILKMISEKEVPKTIYLPTNMLVAESCGCIKYQSRENSFYQYIFNFRRQQDRFRFSLDRWQRLFMCNNTEEFKSTMNELALSFDSKLFCLCINKDEQTYRYRSDDDFRRTGYDRAMYLNYSLNKGVVDDTTTFFATKDLFPPNFINDTSTVYLFAPLFFNGRSFGYCIVEEGQMLMEHLSLYSWIKTLSNALEIQRQKKCLAKLTEQLNMLYIKDSMTDLYNRTGLARFAPEMFEVNNSNSVSTEILFIDMDGLKKINDNFGHSAGDEAIIALSTILKSVCPKSHINVRFGGDEFLIIGPSNCSDSAQKLKNKIMNEFDRYNSAPDREYNVEASIGFLLTDPSSQKALNDYIEEADNLMYQEKVKRKKERLN